MDLLCVLTGLLSPSNDDQEDIIEAIQTSALNTIYEMPGFSHNVGTTADVVGIRMNIK